MERGMVNMERDMVNMERDIVNMEICKQNTIRIMTNKGMEFMKMGTNIVMI
jgi:hypothetical protein